MSITTHLPRQRVARLAATPSRRRQARTRSKDQFCFKHTRERRSGYVHCWLCSLRVRTNKSPRAFIHPDRNDRICSLFTMLDICAAHRNEQRSCLKDESRAPAGCRIRRMVEPAQQPACLVASASRCAAAPPLQNRLAEPFQGNGGARRDRTDDLKLAKLALSQLSYGPDCRTADHLLTDRRSARPTGRRARLRESQGRGGGRRRLRLLE